MFIFKKKIHFLTITLLFASTVLLPMRTATAQLKATLEGHTDNVWSVAFSPNGKMLASASWDQSVRLWNVNTGRLLHTLTGHTNAIMSVAFSPDGNTLASGSWDGTIRLWNPRNGKLKRTLTEHAGGVTSVTFSPDGNTLAGGSADRTIRLWNTNTWKLKGTLTGHTDVVESVAFSPDGNTLASGSRDTTIRLWNPNNERHKRTLTEHTAPVSAVAFSPDGNTLASGGRDQTIRLWNPINGREKETLTGYTDGVNPVAFSPDGATLLIGGHGISVWDTQTGEYKKALAEDIGTAMSVIFSPDGQMVASGSADHKVRLWEFNASDYEFPSITTNGMVRLVYFLPNDRPVRPDRIEALRQLIKDAQQFFADEMERHGFGGKTFTIETDKSGEPVVHQIHGKFEEDYYHHGNPDPPDYKVWAELFEHFNDPEHIYFIAIDISQDTLDRACGLGGPTFIPSGEGKPAFVFDSAAVRHRGETPGEQILGGSAIIPASGPCFYDDRGNRHPLGVTTHELGHAFGIEHDSELRQGYDNETVMGGSGHRLSEGNAEWLSVSRFFNNTPRSNNSPGDIQLISKPTYSPEGIKLHFEVADTDGLHQVQLLVPGNLESGSWGAYRLYDYKQLNGKRSRVEFINAALIVDPVDRIMVQIIDKGGGITWATFLTDIAALLPPSKVVSIPDPNLAAAIRTKLGLAPQVPITERRMRGLASLSADDSNIKNLAGLEHATELVDLGLGRNTISNYDPLAQLSKLKVLGLWANGINDLNVLPPMPQLELLDLNWNDISDLSPLAKFTSLKDLWLQGNKLADTSTFFQLHNGTFPPDEEVEVVKERDNLDRVYTLLIFQSLDLKVRVNPNVTVYRSLNAVQNALLSISPSSVTSPAIGEQLTFSLNIAGGVAVAGYQVTLQFDATALRYVESSNGDYLPDGAFFVPPVVKRNRVELASSTLTGVSNGDGTLATITFEVLAVKASTLTLSETLLSNSTGNTFRPQIEGGEITEPPKLTGDVNGDGVVNIQDLVLVASNFGEAGQNVADVNGDGVVNIADLVLVAGALGNAAAAPLLYPDALEMLTAADVGEWLSQAQHADLTDATSQRGILMLQQLLAALIPKETSLLPNYPNPFNPETWIPYQLSEPTAVTLHIYAVDGTLIRTLALGHQPAGMYQSKSRAVYWDGKNEVGEPVASGVYFYTLSAGDFSATRKMLIRK